MQTFFVTPLCFSSFNKSLLITIFYILYLFFLSCYIFISECYCWELRRYVQLQRSSHLSIWKMRIILHPVCIFIYQFLSQPKRIESSDFQPRDHKCSLAWKKFPSFYNAFSFHIYFSTLFVITRGKDCDIKNLGSWSMAPKNLCYPVIGRSHDRTLLDILTIFLRHGVLVN